MPLSASEKKELIEAQKRFIFERLTNDQAKAEWVANVARVHEALLDERIGMLVDFEKIEALLKAVHSREMIEQVASPIANTYKEEVLEWVKSEKLPLGHFLPTESRTEIDRLLEGPNLVPERFIREVIEHEALEGVMREVLHDTIREFNEKMNPFSSEFGIIAMLKKMMPLGFGAVSKTIDVVRAEFEKRLEPELVKFLNSVSKRALQKMCTMTLEKWQEAEFVTLRKSVFAFLLEQPVADVAANLNAQTIATGERAAAAALSHLAALPRALEVRHQAIQLFRKRFETETVRHALHEMGASPTLPTAAIAEASWPIVVAALSSPPARSFVDGLIEEFWAGVPTS